MSHQIYNIYFEMITPEIGGGGEVETVEWTDEGGVRGWSLTLDRGSCWVVTDVLARAPSVDNFVKQLLITCFLLLLGEGSSLLISKLPSALLTVVITSSNSSS